MAVLELEQAQVNAVKIAMINVIAIPRQEWGQNDAHAHVCLAFGTEQGGEFIPRYFESHYFKEAEFLQFVQLLGTLEQQTLEAIMQIKGLTGTVR